MSLVGCAKAVSGTPLAASHPTTHSTPTTQPSGSGGSGGNTQASQFCSNITASMVQQAFGVSGAHITPGQQQDTNGVSAVSCLISTQGGPGAIGINVIAFNFAGQNGVTPQSVLQNGQDQLSKSGNASNFQTQSKIGSSDGAFSYSVTAQGSTGFGVYAAKNLQGNTVAIDITAVGAVQLAQVLSFANVIDTN